MMVGMRRNWKGENGRRGDRFDQDIVYASMKFSN